MAPSLALPPSGGRITFWRTAQVLGVAVTVVLIVGFFIQPDFALRVLWNVLIPLLPLTFLITPALWRGMCPLATLNTLPNGLLEQRVLSARALPSVGLVGIMLLYGIFAAAFPGFVVGYLMVTDSPLSMAPSIYFTVLLWAGGSYLLVAFLVGFLKVQAGHVLPILAAAALGLYYWFVAPTVASTVGLSSVGTLLIRCTTLALVGVWLWRALRRVLYASKRAARVLQTPLPALTNTTIISCHIA